MHRLKTVLFNTTFALNCLLLFLLLFEEKLLIPSWLQVAGRMHPLLLHFPIVLLLLAIFWELFSGFKNPYDNTKAAIGDGLLLSASFLAVLTALMGLFLSKEEGYITDALVWHKWSGVFVAVFSFAWYVLREKMRQAKGALLLAALMGLMAIILTGHEGASITHGQDYLLSPIMVAEQKPEVLLEEAEVYTHVVKPILENKCMNCHNTQKAKGGLVMETEALLLKGGKNGVLWDSTEGDWGLMMRRIHLPLEHKKHMPPQGKPQLTEEETEIIYHWIRSGASFTTKLVELPEEDSLRLLAAPLFQTTVTDHFTFAAAADSKIKALRTNYRVVQPLAVGSPALAVNFFSAAQFSNAQLKELLDLKEQVVTLNLNKMPVVDEDLNTIAQFQNLRELNLSFTKLNGSTLPALSQLKALKSLSLSGTQVKANDLRALASLPQLQHLYLWNTDVSPTDLLKVQQQLHGVLIESGFTGDTITIQLNPPIIENEEQVVVQSTPLKLKHYINGVAIRYTTDGSEPDSTKSPLYKADIIIDRNMTLKAKAFKSGWISSEIVEKTFYKAGFRPDSVQLLRAPDPQYKGEGGATLTNGQKGDLNFRSGKWLGYKQQPLEALLYFQKINKISSVTISSITDIGSYIMPPQQIEVWGGLQAGQLRLLQRLTPQQPTKEKAASMKGYELSFTPTDIRFLKIVVKPVPHLPAWHKGKGDKAWIFVDEVFVN